MDTQGLFARFMLQFARVRASDSHLGHKAHPTFLSSGTKAHYVYKQKLNAPPRKRRSRARAKPKNKSGHFIARLFSQKLFSLDCARRASIFASAAINASVCINYVFICAFGDCVPGTSSCASATAYAFVRNYVCHF